MQLYDLTPKGESLTGEIHHEMDPKGWSRIRTLLNDIKYAGTIGPGLEKLLARALRNGYIVEVDSRPDLEFYHFTPEKNVTSIKQLGLEAKREGQETGSTWEEDPLGRIYLFSEKKGVRPKSFWDEFLGEEIWPGREEERFTSFKVRLPKSIELERDPFSAVYKRNSKKSFTSYGY